jgi:gamma-glutamyltranspeptidase/glutathione hydrolase
VSSLAQTLSQEERPGRGLVSTSHRLASEAGAEILRLGGNAVDAAAAVQFALNVVEPVASGIGGGGFSLVRLAQVDTARQAIQQAQAGAQGRLFVLDSRERAPAAASADQFLGPDGAPIPPHERETGGNAVGVPGVLMGHAVAVQRWGRLSLARTLEPAIQLAERGVPVDAFLARRLQANLGLVGTNSATAAIFLPDGRPLVEGDWLNQLDLARTFRLIAEHGPDVFYRGDIAKALAETVQSHGGRMTVDDLASYGVEFREPLYGTYRGLEIATMPPPGAGVSLLQMLGLLEHFDLASLARLGPARAHLELQAMRLALADRAAYLADPGYAPVPVDELLDRNYLAARRTLIELERLGADPAAGTPSGPAFSHDAATPAISLAENGQTTHFVVVDGWSNLVCCSTTIESWFGTGITVPGYGFLLNNELTDFDPNPGSANQARPFARPASSMVPTLILREGQPLLALGSPGGPTIVGAVLQVILSVIDDGLSLQAAIEAPRFFAKDYPRMTWEQGLPQETLAGLVELGHQPADEPAIIGCVQAAMRDPASEQWTAAADPRRDGAVIVVE